MTAWSRLVFEEEELGIPGVHSVGQYNYVAAKAGLPPHQHRGCVEISLLVKGEQTYRVGGKTYQVKGGEQYISLPGEIHDTGSQPEDKGILYWLILNVTENPGQFLFLTPGMAQKLIADLLQLSSRHLVASDESQSTLERAFRALQRIRAPHECTGGYRKNGAVKTSALNPGRSQVPGNDSVHLLEAASSIVYYVSQTIAASKAGGRGISSPIKASIDFIARKPEAWLNVVEVAREVRLSESIFKNRFREEVGTPPAEYMLRQKVDLAKTLLGQPGCRITEVAYRLGFCSSQYFSTVFKRFSNLTPSEFMKGQHTELAEIHD